jgi:23S rRNA (cytosine1962-C5)-methyltransferase
MRPPMTDLAVSPPLSAARVILKPRKALPFFGRHPWVRDTAIDRVEPTGLASEHYLDLDGQVVDLLTDKGKFVARGLFNSQSRIRVRLFTWSAEESLDEAFFESRIERAIGLRRQLGLESFNEQPQATVSPEMASEFAVASGSPLNERSGTAVRLVFSEADGLSGLVVDRYGDYLVIQVTALAIAQRLEMIVGILQRLQQPKAIVLRTEKTMAQMEGVEFTSDQVWGELPAGPIEIREHGLSYLVDLHEGQKTGLYLDQRDNRRAVAGYVRGGRVLDMFCYTGGFSLAAAKLGGAREVLGIDGSKRAIAQARDNAERNSLPGVRFDTGDGFQTLDALAARGEKFDAVILDPPKFARSKSGISGALMAYHRLNRSALSLLPPGGILVTCSCSGSVTREDFVLMLSGVAQKAHRDVQILEMRGAAADHPVSATCLETEYLKCCICRVW